MDGEFGVVRGLDGFIDDAVDDSQAVKVEICTVCGAVGNGLILVVEVIKKCRAILV